MHVAQTVYKKILITVESLTDVPLFFTVYAVRA